MTKGRVRSKRQKKETYVTRAKAVTVGSSVGPSWQPCQCTAVLVSRRPHCLYRHSRSSMHQTSVLAVNILCYSFSQSSPTTGWRSVCVPAQLFASAHPNSCLRPIGPLHTLDFVFAARTACLLRLLFYMRFAIRSRFVISRAVALLPFISSTPDRVSPKGTSFVTHHFALELLPCTSGTYRLPCMYLILVFMPLKIQVGFIPDNGQVFARLSRVISTLCLSSSWFSPLCTLHMNPRPHASPSTPHSVYFKLINDASVLQKSGHSTYSFIWPLNQLRPKGVLLAISMVFLSGTQFSC